MSQQSGNLLAAKPNVSPRSHATGGSPLSGISVLIVDDSKTFCRATSAILVSAGARTFSQTSAFGMGARILADNIDIVLLDIEIPGFSGTTALDVLRAREKTKILPVILVSSCPASELAELASRHGANGYLCKGNLAYLKVHLPRKIAATMRSLGHPGV